MASLRPEGIQLSWEKEEVSADADGGFRKIYKEKRPKWSFFYKQLKIIF